MLLNRKRLFVETSARVFFPFLETEPFVLEGRKTVKYYLN